MPTAKSTPSNRRSLKRKAEHLDKETSIRESHDMLMGRSDMDFSFEIYEDKGDSEAQNSPAAHTCSDSSLTIFEDPCETVLARSISSGQDKETSKELMRKPLGLLYKSYFRVETLGDYENHSEFAIPGRTSFHDWTQSSSARNLQVPHPMFPRVNLALLDRAADLYGKEVDVDY